jgi:TolB-like protein
LERRLAAILAADVVGYSKLMGEDQQGTLEALRELRVDVLGPIVRKHRGNLIKSLGDGWIVEFPSISDAVNCAMQVQEGLIAHPLIRLRIGIHTGEVVFEDEDVFGDGVNIAARLEALAEPGQVVISDTAHNSLDVKSTEHFVGGESRELKNIARLVAVWHWPAGDETTAIEATALPLPDKPSIAVLPFDNMSGDPEQEYFADGMVEEIITGLACIRWLTVIARNSTFAYKGKSIDVHQVSRELAVRYVVEGSVRKAGNKVRITAQLIDAETRGHLWAKTFSGALDDVFELEDQITAGVVAAIEPSVRQAEIDRAKRKRPDNLDAYDIYLRALEQSYTYTPAGRDAGLSLLETAIELDSSYAEAHGLAAFCLQQRFLWGGRAAADREAALLHAEAVAVARTDDATTLAFAALAFSALAGRHEIARVMVDRALENNPSSAIAHNVYVIINMLLGQPDESVFHAERSLELSPFDPLRHIPECGLSVANLAAGQYEDALACVRRGLEANPAFSPGLITLALCLVRLDRIDEARATVSRLVEIAPDTRVATLQERYLFSNGLGIDRIVADLRLAGMPE